MIAASDRAVLIADAGTPSPGSGMARARGPEDVNATVTHPSTDPATCAAHREAGVEVVEACS
jgi:hypothetical protein